MPYLPRLFTLLAPGLLLAAMLAQPAKAATTLEAIKARGSLKCAVLAGSPGYAAPDATGALQGFDVDFCRATAAAVLGDPNKVQIVPATSTSRFPQLKSGEVDVVFGQITTTFTRDATLGFLTGPITVYDAQAFMVPKRLGVKTVKDLDGASVCIVPGTNAELNIGDYFRANNIKYQPVSLENLDEIRKAFFSGRCDIFSSDRTFLAAIRAVSPRPDDYEVLPFNVSRSPIAPMVRQGDDQWYNIVRWVVWSTLVAEELGVNQANARKIHDAPSRPALARFLGRDPNFSKGLGLDDEWAYRAVQAVGNYKEIYDRNLGEKSPLKVPRGQNELPQNGGLQYTPAFL